MKLVGHPETCLYGLGGHGTHIEVFPKMNHGQLLVDRPEEVARRILEMV